MNNQTINTIMKFIYGWTSFPINQRGIAFGVDSHGDITEITVKGRGKAFKIAYNYGTDAFDCTDSRGTLEGLYIDQLKDYIARAK
jgi:hypothetical protein